MTLQKRAAAWVAVFIASSVALAGCTTGGTDDGPRPTASGTVSQGTTLALPAATSASGPADSGPREGARGDAIVSDDLEAYLVADGDELGSIAERFGVDVSELTHSGGTSLGADELAAGDYVFFTREHGDAAPSSPALADSGARDHATGEAIVDADGVVVKYVVAEDDRGDEIGLRFGTIAKQIYYDEGDFEGRNILNWSQIHPGDVLRFEP